MLTNELSPASLEKAVHNNVGSEEIRASAVAFRKNILLHSLHKVQLEMLHFKEFWKLSYLVVVFTQ